MTDVKLDNLDETVLSGLADRAEANGRSLEDEAASIIKDAVVPLPDRLGSRLRARFAPLGGVDLVLPDRPITRTPPFAFDEVDEEA